MTYHARVTESGEVVVPAGLAGALGLRPGDRLSMDAEGACIVVKTQSDLVRVGQEAFRVTIKRPFTVDEFIADRRAEAAQE